jgi:iron-sulfur cluster insertion protein
MTDIQVISMTENAARRVAQIAEKLGKPPVLRLSVEGGGCSGFQYKFGIAETVEADDIRAEAEGASLVVDPVSLDLVRGSAIDFVESLGGKSFQVTNPQAQAGCGCGSSFSV